MTDLKKSKAILAQEECHTKTNKERVVRHNIFPSKLQLLYFTDNVTYPEFDANSSTIQDFHKNFSYEEYAKASYFFDSYIYYVDGILLLCVSIFGIIGTTMSLFVLVKPRIRDFFSNFLTALSIFDCLFLILAVLYIGLPAVSYWYVTEGQRKRSKYFKY